MNETVHKRRYVHIKTHTGKDQDDMCLFLNHNRIGYSVTECHNLVGDAAFKDWPHYTANFRCGWFTETGIDNVTTKIKENCKHITYTMTVSEDKYG